MNEYLENEKKLTTAHRRAIEQIVKTNFQNSVGKFDSSKYYKRDKERRYDFIVHRSHNIELATESEMRAAKREILTYLTNEGFKEISVAFGEKADGSNYGNMGATYCNLICAVYVGDMIDSILKEADALDDYEESLVEDTVMSDAQRLALQELDSCLECGEVTQEEHDAGQHIQWDINFEDVVLFIAGIDVPLKDVKNVSYGDCDESEFDGCYSVEMNDGSIKKYGWHDADMTGALTPIDEDTNSLTESDDGWEKPFDWTEMYRKDGFMISNNYQGAWHLEQTRPKTKHFGNYSSLEAAKAAGDAEINKRNAKNKNKPVQFGVHSFTSDSIVFRGTEEECAEYINNNRLENEAEIYMMTANDRHYLEEDAGKRFNKGDRVYVTVSNRQGTVTKMVSPDVVEVEFEANGTYPARIDRFYTSEVELIDMTPDLDESFEEEYWAVFATDTSTGKEYCAGVYGSERDAYYWAGMDRSSDIEYNYGNFKYRVERVAEYSDALDSSKRQLDTLKLFNHSTAKNDMIDDDF